MLIDIHQHIWTEPLLDRLAARDEPPLVRRSDGLTVLHCSAEPPYVIDVDSEAPERRASLVAEDGLDLALVALSSPIGIEALPRDSALELIEAQLEGVAELPREFAAWGPIALDGADVGRCEPRARTRLRGNHAAGRGARRTRSPGAAESAAGSCGRAPGAGVHPPGPRPWAATRGD